MFVRKIAFACIVVTGVACSSPPASSEAQCVGHTSSATSAAGSRAVSFERDVLPVFGQSCVFGACHGAKGGNDHGIYLGAKGSTDDAAEIRAALLERGPARVPSMRFVKPNDPANSYLIRKLEGSFCDIPACDDGACGDRMPRGGEPLDPAAREIVEAWIAQGAGP
ncbi:MAG: hypothetical protein KF819_12270 [Labilithrix sp.]|nr:hypothetical protein [Labilithrix sp.]